MRGRGIERVGVSPIVEWENGQREGEREEKNRKGEVRMRSGKILAEVGTIEFFELCLILCGWSRWFILSNLPQVGEYSSLNLMAFYTIS